MFCFALFLLSKYSGEKLDGVVEYSFVCLFTFNVVCLDLFFIVLRLLGYTNMCHFGSPPVKVALFFPGYLIDKITPGVLGCRYLLEGLTPHLIAKEQC